MAECVQNACSTFSRMRASILVPCYNSAPTLERCLASARAQTLRDIEILVADDASTDEGAALAERIAAEDPRIRVIRLHPNGGKPRAMNVLMAQARGEWVAVLDADDAFDPVRLERLIGRAEAACVDMAADNLLYIDAGLPSGTGPAAFGTVLRAAFDPGREERIIGRADLVAGADSFGDFDYGILKPVIRGTFVRAHGLAYSEASRLAEDFTYLLAYCVAGGRCVLVSEPLYHWTMPFGTISRRWTATGAGAWRYDYRAALRANMQLIAEMRERGEMDVVGMLERRGRQYGSMIHYIDAQKQAASRAYVAALRTIVGHPSTWRLLARRVSGRLARTLRSGRPVPAAPGR